MANRFHPSTPRAASPGFTLVEVALALGIFVVAFVSIMALLPAGLGNLTNAGTKALRSQVIRTVATELRQTPFQDLRKPEFLDREFHFTGDGLPISKDKREAVVTAKIEKLEFGLPLNGVSQDRVARATVVVSQFGQEIARTIVFLPDVGR